MRVAPIERVGGAEGETAGKAEGKAAEEEAAEEEEAVEGKARGRHWKRAGKSRSSSPSRARQRCGEPVAGVGTVPSGPPALDAAGSVDDARSGAPAGP